MSTAAWIAAARARESARPDRLFDDPRAHLLAGESGRARLAANERAAGGENAEPGQDGASFGRLGSRLDGGADATTRAYLVAAERSTEINEPADRVGP